MTGTVSITPNPETKVSVEEVNRILEVGRLLHSVLTPEELEALQSLGVHSPLNSIPVDLSSKSGISNTGVT